MSPHAHSPQGALATAIDETFGGFDALAEAFVEAGTGLFGSGWVWLTTRGRDRLRITPTHDAQTLGVAEGETPLLVCDVWEHAYYIDTRNDRKTYVANWFAKLANWNFAESQYDAALRDLPGFTYPTENRPANPDGTRSVEAAHAR